VRKATEIVARICVHNMRRLAYLKYMRGIDPSIFFFQQPGLSFRTT
jgi:hypothetical protein